MTPAPIIQDEGANIPEETIEMPADAIQIVNAMPPVWEKAHKAFNIDDKSTVYAYGRIIYNPSGVEIPEHVIEHEVTHMRQQESSGGPEKWWDMYNAPMSRMEAMQAIRG